MIPRTPARQGLRFSFIVPFHSGLATLTQCLRALTPLPDDSELLIAADGAIDDCSRLASETGARVIHVDGPSGPAVARNRAASEAEGRVLVFIDADVVVSRAALERLDQIFAERPDTTAVFGSYDDTPADPRFISQYKNLSHAFVHRSSSSQARTFWTGFGAVRRDAFLSVGGFDERFTRPSVEDIDLGYRLTDAGYRVVLDSSLSACHLKRWGLKSAVVSDLRDRGIPWTQLIWRYGALDNDLNLRTENRWCILFAYLSIALLALMPFNSGAPFALAMALGTLTILNRPHYRFFYEKRGATFAAGAWSMHQLHHLCNGISFVAGTGLFVSARYLGLRLPGALPAEPWTGSRTARAASIARADEEDIESGAYGALADRAISAAPWRLASVAVIGVSQLVVGIILARLLMPADFGVMTLVVVVLGLMQPLADLGVANAIVQRAQLTDRHVRTAFTFSVLLGTAVAAAVLLVAPWLATLLRDPAMLPILRVLAAAFAVRGTATVAGALLRRRLDFRTQFQIDGVSYVVGYGAVAMTMATSGYGVWALVWGTFVQTVLSAVAQLAAARHSYRPLLAWQELGELLRFGFGAAVSGAANYAALNGDNFIVGRWIGVASLGLYERAYFLMNLPYTCVANVLSGVMFPAFARVQNDPAALRTGYLLVTQITAMIAAPAMATMAVAAPHLVPALYGPRWTGLVVPLQILCAAGYFRALYHLGGIVAQSAGRVYSELWRQALYACFVVGGAVAGMAYGLAGVAIGVGIAILYMFAATGSLALRVTSTTWTHYFRVQLSALLTATVTYVIVVLVRALLVRWALPDEAIAAGILVAAIPSWSLGMLWTLSDPQCAPLRSRLPAWCARLIPLGTADDASAASERGPAISAVP